MAITKKLIHFKQFSNFNTQKLSANRENTSYTVGVSGSVVSGEPYIFYQSIVFIQDVLKIWTHGSLYDCGAVDISAYLTADEIAEVYATIGALNGKQDEITDLETIRSGASKGATAVQPSSLANVATSGSYNDLSDKPTIPSAVTESTVSGWGFTKNTGTYSKPSTGIPKTDLASAVQTSLGKADTALQSFTETDPVFSASAAAGIKSSDITNWNNKTSNTGTITGIKMNGTSKGTSGEVDLGTVITEHQDISGKLDATVAASTYLSKTEASTTYLGKTDKVASATKADSAEVATNIEEAPVLEVVGNDIQVVIGDKTSNAVTPYYASTSGNARSAETATNLYYAPTITIEGNYIRISAGGKSSDAITVPYATKVAVAEKARALETSRKIYGQYFDGTSDVTAGPILGNGKSFSFQDSGGTSRNIVYYDTSNNCWFGRGVGATGGSTSVCGTTVKLCATESLTVIGTVSSSGIAVNGTVTQTSDIRKKNVGESVLLSVNEIANAPLFQYVLKDDESKTEHIGTSAQYWAETIGYSSFCKKDDEGYYSMDISNCALASAISIAKDYCQYKLESEQLIADLRKEIEDIKTDIYR